MPRRIAWHCLAAAASLNLVEWAAELIGLHGNWMLARFVLGIALGMAGVMLVKDFETDKHSHSSKGSLKWGTLAVVFARYTLRDRRSIGDGDDDVALLVSLLDVPMGFGDPLQRVSPVDHRLQLPRLGELSEPDEIVAAKSR